MEASNVDPHWHLIFFADNDAGGDPWVGIRDPAVVRARLNLSHPLIYP